MGQPKLAQHEPGETTLRDDPVEQVCAAQRAWQRAELRRFVVGHPTLSCDQGPRARRYLREATGVQLADAQALPYDIIYRRKPDGSRRGYVYLVDDLAQPADVVLSWLPRPKLPKVQIAVLFRPGQDGSVHDSATETWSYSQRALHIIKAIHENLDFMELNPAWFGSTGILDLARPRPAPSERA